MGSEHDEPVSMSDGRSERRFRLVRCRPIGQTNNSNWGCRQGKRVSGQDRVKLVRVVMKASGRKSGCRVPSSSQTRPHILPDVPGDVFLNPQRVRGAGGQESCAVLAATAFPAQRPRPDVTFAFRPTRVLPFPARDPVLPTTPGAIGEAEAGVVSGGRVI